MEARASRLLKRCLRAGVFLSLLYGSYRGSLSALAYSNHLALATIPPSPASNLAPGDLLFMRFECSRLPSPGEIMSCYKEQLFRGLVFALSREKRYRQGEWEAVAVVAQGADDTRVLGYLNGAYCNYSARSFVEMPFLSRVVVRRLITLEPHMDRRSFHFVEAVETLQQTLHEGWGMKKAEAFRDSVDLVINFLVHVDLASTSELKTLLKLTVEDLNVQRPKFIGVGAGQYSDPIPLKPFTPF